jgi:cytochrome c peroxidase
MSARAALQSIFLAALFSLSAAVPARTGVFEFSAEERARILAHGPWPVARIRDASNRVDGLPEAVALGRRLFFDKRLSASGQVSCGSCHDPKRSFQDGLRFSRHGRNTIGLLDAGHQRWYRWDGGADSLWAASLAPLTASDELAATPQRVLTLLKRDQQIDKSYRRLFGVPAQDEHLMVNVAKALAAYQATLASSRTAFDAFRDALARGDQVAASRYPMAAQRGLKIFIASGRCFFCHVGPAFTNGEFADIGRPFFTDGGVDPGRWGGLQQLLASPYSRLGRFSDSPAQAAVATRHVVMEPRHFGEFKVPGLRGLVATAPYFHDGSAPDLESVAQHYNELDETRLHVDGVRLLRALKLTPAELADLTAFLKTLSVSTSRPRGR